jgi:hypothetical protein
MGRTFQDIKDIQKRKKCDEGSESFPTTGVQKVSISGSIVGLSA